MLKGKITFILLLFVSLSFGQSKMKLASYQQANSDPWKARFGSELLLYMTPESIDTDAITDGTALSMTGAPIWADLSDNAFSVTLGAGTFALNIGSTGRQLEWTGSSWLDIVDDAALEHNTNIPYAIVYRVGDASGQTGSGYVLAKAPSGGGREGGGYFNSLNTYAGFYAGGTTTAPSPTTAAPNHVCIIQFNSSTMDVWIDGTQVITGATRGTTDNDGQSWNIGARTDGGYIMASGFMMDYAIIIGNNSTGYTLTADDRAWIWSQLQVN